MEGKKEKFSGYRVVIGCTIHMILLMGFQMILGVAMALMPEYYHTDLVAISSVIVVNGFSAFLVGFVAYRIIRRLTLRGCIWYGAASTLAFGILICYWPTLPGALVAFIIAGTTTVLSQASIVTAIIANWFVEKRTMLTTVVLAGASMGAAVFQSLSGYVMNALGMGKGYLVLATAVAVLIVVNGIFLIREKPEDLGQTALGAEKDTEMKKETKQVDVSITAPKNMWTNLTFVFFAIASLLAIKQFGMWGTYGTTFMTGHGMDYVSAANVVAISTFISSIFSLVSGWMIEKFSVRRCFFLWYILVIAHHIFLLLFGIKNQVPLLYVGAFCYAAAFPLGTIHNVLSNILFTHEDALRANSLMTGLRQGFNAALSPVMAAIVTMMGFSFSFVFWAVIAVFAFVFYLLAMQQAAKQGRKI